MKLTVEDVAKMTGLTESTVRQYSWERKIGKREGRSKVFTLADAKKIGGLKDGSKSSRQAKKSQSANKTPPPVKSVRKAERQKPKKEQRSFWSFLGTGRKPKRKARNPRARRE